ncbi:MAG: aminopeptidase P family protein, partial [Gammaproteobacteria bacterium]|nr:aminopeptidase P family protein [Gammaproteobacteria bacterium]
KAAFAFDEAYSIEQLPEKMPELLANQPALWWPFATHKGFEENVERWLDVVRGKVRQFVSAPRAQIDLCALVDEMRLVKDAHEIDVMRRAAQISAEAHKRAMRASKPGLREYHLEAEILHHFRMNGSQFPAYGSIVATGPNACVLHYRADAAELRDGDLCLIDAGCELDSYASDITRTFPVNGKFTGPQKALYEIVLDSQLKAIDATRVGRRFTDPHVAATRVLVQGMLDTGLLDKAKVGSDIDDIVAKGAHTQFYMHRTGHWLGMDVHDVGDYKVGGEWRVLEPGMVLTVEPGLYISAGGKGVAKKWWNIGIRIEDDVLVTPTGCVVLSAAMPKTADEVEALMQA